MSETPPAQDADTSAPVLSIRDLTVRFGQAAPVLDGIDLDIGRGELLCVVGESGSGKSVTALAAMGLLPPAAQISATRMMLGDKAGDVDLAGLGERQLERLRGNRMAMVFQEPMTSLNPVMTIGRQIAEPLIRHHGLDAGEARTRALEMLRQVHVPAPEQRYAQYPHQLSGGLRQRVMIAMALVCRPALLIADEPTTALDVTIQSQILRLIDELRAELDTAVMFITHDLAVVSEIADRVAVIYAGRIVEEGRRAQIFEDPQHPYTLSLFASMPRLVAEDVSGGGRLAPIGGQVPAPGNMPAGCRFAPRCPFAVTRCMAEVPPLAAPAGSAGDGHRVACWRAPLEETLG
ncbi:ABC transporter ATP-binding protein [Acidimangrovimonas sediminis]|uniref:ABC transporter ATP-binding protein n=1 Tax=Acidimangrovimonas sediminis TaxID=2056283 RepID=UPI000C7FFC94|nr:ABC transporter ATP-binding protein [Acidimangrovimonas sediminis]